MANHFQSIDNSVPHLSISDENTANNLKQFQPLVCPGIGHGMSRPFGMDSSASQSTGLLNRQDSVPDEALFGNGSDDSQDKRKDSSPQTAGLPAFDLMMGSSGSSNPDDPDFNISNDKVKRDNEVVEVVVRPKESMNAAERRKTLTRSTGSIGSDVFDDVSDLPDGAKSSLNPSLPDLVLSSPSSSSSLPQVSHGKESPDVTLNSDSESEQIVRTSQSIKDLIEGPSSIGGKKDSSCKMSEDKKESSTKMSGGKKRPCTKLIMRTVSFDEHSQLKYIDDEETNEVTETCPLNDNKEPIESRPRIPSTPQTPQEKRERFSESSGYITGSDERGSREGSSQKNSMDSQSFHVNSSLESGNGSFEISENVLNNMQKMTMEDSQKVDSKENSFGSNTISSNNSGTIFHSDSSTKTVQSEASVHDETIENNEEAAKNNAELAAVNGSSAAANADDPDIPKLSIFNKGQEVFYPLTTQPASIGDHSHTQPSSCAFSTPSTIDVTQSDVDKVDKENEQIIQYVQGKLKGDNLQPTGSLMPMEPPSYVHHLLPEEVIKMHLVDNMIQDNMSPTSILRFLKLFYDTIESPSPSPHHSKKQFSPDFHSLKVADLERASRCTDNECKEICCVKWLDIQRMLNLDLPVLDQHYPLLKAYCKALWEHRQYCDEPVCPVQYCDLINKWDTNTYVEAADPKRIVEGIQSVLVEPLMKTLTEEISQVLKLQDGFPNRTKEDFEVSFLALSKIGDFGDYLLCCDINTNHLYVQQTYPMFEADHQLALYTRLKNLSHPNIVSQLWLLQCEDFIKVYTDFLPGGSLLEYIRQRGPLPWTLTVHYMKQLLEAVVYLHSIGVVYLFWHSGNMLFQDCERHVIKISSFGYSYPKNCDSDMGTTKACLPYNLCPPELLRQNRIDFLSDSWGAGCLMAEMHTGKPVWYKERHEDRDTVHKNIQQNFPKVDTQTTNQKEAFQFCWQSQPERRKTVQELLSHLWSSDD